MSLAGLAHAWASTKRRRISPEPKLVDRRAAIIRLNYYIKRAFALEEYEKNETFGCIRSSNDI